MGIFASHPLLSPIMSIPIPATRLSAKSLKWVTKYRGFMLVIVVLQSGPNCLSTGVQPVCRSCAAGNYNLCEHGDFPGPYPFGGGWSEEMLLHEQQLFRVPPEMNDEQAVLLEPAAVAVHAALRRLPRSADRVLIIGASSIGLLLLQVIRALVPQAEISVAARYPFQVKQATRLGAAHILYPQDGYQAVQRTTGAQLYQG